MAKFQLQLFGAPRAKRVCFFDVGAAKAHAKFSAYTPKALIYFAKKYDLPVLSNPADLADFDVVLFSLHCFRDYYKIARIAHHKRPGQEWIAGGNACTTPVGVSWIMDYVWIGDCRASFPLILKGERHLQGLWSARDPDRIIRYTDEDIEPEPLTPSEIEMSKGCPRRCLFCIHPWRHRYQESPQEKIEAFIRAHPGKGIGLVSNSSDDVSYYYKIADLLTEVGKTDMIVSNAVQGLTEEVVSQRKREMLLGVEGMSERLRWIVNKPISRKVYMDKLDLCLRHGRQIRSVHQFNLPGEEARDFDEFLADVKYMRKQHKKGSWALPFIPNQPSAHTPFQWVTPRYSVEMSERIMDFRKSMFGSGQDGITCYAPAPLGPSKWFSQVIAEWIPITPKVADAVEKLPQKREVPEMIQALDSMGVTLPQAFLHRDEHTVFPWSHILTTGDDPDKWKRYVGMIRKMQSSRFTGGSEAQAEHASASEAM